MQDYLMLKNNGMFRDAEDFNIERLQVYMYIASQVVAPLQWLREKFKMIVRHLVI